MFGVAVHALEEIGERVSMRTCVLVCTSDCSEIFQIARAIQDLFFRNTKFLVAEPHQMSHLG